MAAESPKGLGWTYLTETQNFTSTCDNFVFCTLQLNWQKSLWQNEFEESFSEISSLQVEYVLTMKCLESQQLFGICWTDFYIASVLF